MCRPSHLVAKLDKARRLSKKGQGRASVILEERGQLREYLSYRDGELEIYDTTGCAKNQISPTKQEYLILKAMEAKGFQELEKSCDITQ